MYRNTQYCIKHPVVYLTKSSENLYGIDSVTITETLEKKKKKKKANFIHSVVLRYDGTRQMLAAIHKHFSRESFCVCNSLITCWAKQEVVLVGWLWASPAAVFLLLYHRHALFEILIQITAPRQSSTFQGSAFSHNYRLTFVLCTFKGGSCYKLPQVGRKKEKQQHS